LTNFFALDTLLTFNNQQQIDEGQIFGKKNFTFQPKVHPFDDSKLIFQHD
jgi:hypothetical protein